MLRLIKLFFISALVVISLLVIFHNLPREYKHSITDYYQRLNSPVFAVELDYISAKSQTELIQEYNNRGHKMDCYNTLREMDKFDKRTDYVCYAHISSAFDDIPARTFAFFFSKNELILYRVEFPQTSNEKLQEYLHRKLDGYKGRSLKAAEHNDNNNNQASDLWVWLVNNGMIITEPNPSTDKNIILLWQRYDI